MDTFSLSRITNRTRGLVALVVVLALTTAAGAKPAHKQALAQYFGPALASSLNDCRTCHVPTPPGQDEEGSEKPHNPFGARLAAVREELKKFGKKTDIPSRLEAMAEEDSDKDGVPNLIELLSGHRPGEADDRPNAEEVSRARAALPAFLRAKKAGRWDPFAGVRRPSVPSVKDPVWGRNPVDAFLAAGHEQRGLRPRPEASKPVLLRRVYLDLIGLPPTRAELQAFLQDDAPDAYEKVVEGLLNRPQHGERWGRHWLDVWRYADWAGYGAEVRESQPHLWRWRDWVVESLNADKGYDRMIQEMLAGDELAPDDPDTLRATGFLVRNWYLFNRNVALQNAVEHTAKAFLGVTMNCARCHDHFFDPITADDYYRFRAIFEPHHVRVDRLPGQPDRTKAGLVRAYDAFPENPTHLHVRGNENQVDKGKSYAPGVPAVLGGRFEVRPVPLPRGVTHPDKQEFVIRETVAAGEEAVARTREAHRAALRHQVVSTLPPPGPTLLLYGSLIQYRAAEVDLARAEAELAEARHAALTEVLKAERLEDAGQKGTPDWERAATEAAGRQRREALASARHNLLSARLTPAKKGEERRKKIDEADKALAKTEAAPPVSPATAYTPRPLTYPRAKVHYSETPDNKPYPEASTGRRLALARWITDEQNPLTARVAVNHLWLRHFGAPLVPTVFDFGGNGQPPTHPELLDWLAAELMAPTTRQGPRWGLKHLHRILVTSRAYRADSNADPEGAALDPDNRAWWRMNPRRMEAEVVRDSVLHLAGQLDPTLGGPEVPHAQGLTSRRRSLYFQHAAEKQMEFLLLFDAANVTECYKRSSSIMPQQALALANSPLAQNQARLLARQLAATSAEAAAFVTAAYQQILGRSPTSGEVAACVQFLGDQAALLADRARQTPFAGTKPNAVAPAADPQARAREGLVHVLFNHNDFVTIR